jgi:hypothetical protein
VSGILYGIYKFCTSCVLKRTNITKEWMYAVVCQLHWTESTYQIIWWKIWTYNSTRNEEPTRREEPVQIISLIYTKDIYKIHHNNILYNSSVCTSGDGFKTKTVKSFPDIIKPSSVGGSRSEFRPWPRYPDWDFSWVSLFRVYTERESQNKLPLFWFPAQFVRSCPYHIRRYITSTILELIPSIINTNA